MKKRVRSHYRVKNWPEYNRALTERGSVNLWIAPDIEKTWLAEPDGSRGCPRTYSEKAMEVMALLRAVFHLTLRMAEGFLRSLFPRLRIDLPVPHASTVSRRTTSLKVALGPLHILIDSTGIKIYGEGEWKVRKHGASKRRTWDKHHIAVDARTRKTLAVVTTRSTVQDPEVVEQLLSQIPGPIASIAGDGIYDTRWCRFLAAERGARALIPPRTNAKPWRETAAGARERNANIARIGEIGRAGWKAEVGYHRRSLVETEMFRQKTIFGERLSSRREVSRACELRVRTLALNMMTELGMPESYTVTPLASTA